MNDPTSFDRSRFLLYAASCAVAATAMISSVTIAAIATERMLRDATWSGVPVALSVLGTAAGSQLLARRLPRAGTRAALTGQYTLAALGAAMAASAVPSRSLLLLCCGLFVVGLGNGATQYTRYLAADTAPAHRRGRALSWAVWMGSFGAVIGPNLLAPTGRLAMRLGLQEEAGPFLFSAVAFAVVAVGYRLLYSDPASERVAAVRSDLDPPPPLGAPLEARVATVAMVLGHVIMVWIMTMTPIHLSHHGHGLGVVGVVISAHVAGMYLLAPLVGALVDRVGAPPVMRTAAVLLAIAAAMAAAVSSERISLPMAVPLFLLGLGWNFGFVGGSARLTAALAPDQQIRGRARADTAIWIGAALASSTSSLVFAQVGFVRLAWAGFGLSVALGVLLLRDRATRLSRSTSEPSAPSHRTSR